MKLKAKLARLSTRGLGPGLIEEAAPSCSADAPQQAAQPSTTRALQLRARIEALRLAKQPAADACDETSGWSEQVIQTPFGPLCQLITTHAPAFCQGDTALLPCLSVSSAQLVALALDASMSEVRSERLLFVDTETTGLAGGAGTLPFLIGVGYFVDEALCIEQWMLRRPGQEVPMLTRLAQCLDEADAIVTYNGKSFDWPLLRNRFILNRVKMPATKPHLDLLHCTRRLLKKRLPEGVLPERGGLRLSRVERDVLGFARVGDIDGAHIPERYFAFLRGGKAALLDPVIEHNRHDLVSLAALLGHAAHRLEDATIAGSAEQHLNLAHLAWRGQHVARAVAFAQQASLSGAAHVRAEAALLLGQLWVSQRQFAQAATALQKGLMPGGHASLRQSMLHLALAKIFEHQLQDIASARMYAVGTLRAEGAAAHAKRLMRLERKQHNQARKQAARQRRNNAAPAAQVGALVGASPP